MRARLGDDIDDFCIKCKRVMNHAVVSLVEEEPAKVRCKTCYSDHDFRHEQPPPPKVDARKAALFNQVLETMQVPPGAAPPVPEAPPEVLEVLLETAPVEEPAVSAAKLRGRRKKSK